jgi:hypothetical protein
VAGGRVTGGRNAWEQGNSEVFLVVIPAKAGIQTSTYTHLSLTTRHSSLAICHLSPATCHLPPASLPKFSTGFLNAISLLSTSLERLKMDKKRV